MLGGLGLAGGFQRAVQVDFVATTELSLASAFVEKCLLDIELLRFVQSYNSSGPAGGRQLALKVSGSCVCSTVAQRLSRIPSRRQR